VAYNDHYRGPNTHTNATAWNVFFTNGFNGPLKDIVTGRDLPGTLTITNWGSVTGSTSAGAPAVNTPAGEIFLGYIDFINPDTNRNSILLRTNQIPVLVQYGITVYWP
jgi:hypothetical protein